MDREVRQIRRMQVETRVKELESAKTVLAKAEVDAKRCIEDLQGRLTR
jgi:hypothetical protein